MNGVAYAIPCWGGDAGDVAPAVSPAADYLTTLGGIIRLEGENFDGDAFKNLKIPSLDNFQTGWWVLGADGSWRETDKPATNSCTANTACAADECCAEWPDTNSRRCVARAKDNVEQTLPPLEPFTPTCAAAGNAAPKSAKDDLAGKAQAAAAAELAAFHDSVEEKAKEVAKYSEMSADDKAKWDEERAIFLAERKTYDDGLREKAGYDGADCDNDCKSVFDAEFLKWKKAVFESCKTSKDSIECR